jgi:ketosteroid isomerase-like protein
MSAESMRVVEEIQAALGSENIVAALADEAVAVRVRETLDRLAEPDFEVTMVAPESAGGGTFEDRGADGFTRLWEDWSEPFAALRIEIEKMIDAGDQVVSLVRQAGRTKTGSVEIEDTSAAVWTVKNGRLSRVDFYLDQEMAMRAAGIAPDSGG